jgi:hypothetical protein
MSFVCSFTLSMQARTDSVRHALRGRSSKRGEARRQVALGLDIQVQLPGSIHSQSNP